MPQNSTQDSSGKAVVPLLELVTFFLKAAIKYRVSDRLEKAVVLSRVVVCECDDGEHFVRCKQVMNVRP